MENTVYIWKLEQPCNDYGAFSDCQNIAQPKDLCSLCEESEAFVEIRVNRGDRIVTSYSCKECYSSTDLRETLGNAVLISVKKL